MRSILLLIIYFCHPCVGQHHNNTGRTLLTVPTCSYGYGLRSKAGSGLWAGGVNSYYSRPLHSAFCDATRKPWFVDADPANSIQCVCLLTTVPSSLSWNLVYNQPTGNGPDLYGIYSRSQFDGPDDQDPVCELCPAGKYSMFIPDAGYGSIFICLNCPSGWTSMPGSVNSVSCVCPAGKYISGSNCLQCPTGKYTNVASQSVCGNCPTGTYASGSGQSTCTLCTSGTYTSSQASISCAACSIGSYTNAAAQAACTLCAAGYYTSTTGQTACTACATGTFLAYPRQTACNQCPSGSWSGSSALGVALADGSITIGYQWQTLSMQCGANGASQCTTWLSTYSTPSEKAIDSDLSTFTHTNLGLLQYWAIDFEIPKPIYNILIWDRSDCCWNRLDKFQIYVSSFKQTGTSFTSNAGNQLCYTDTLDTFSNPTPMRTPAVIQCNGLTGQYLYIVQWDGFQSYYLNFNEIAININPCTLCPVNTYSAAGSISSIACKACPANSVAPKGSHKCRCNVGYSGDGVTCTICPVNTYSAVAGSATCTACPANTNSVTGSTALANCTCNANFFIDPTTLQCRACTTNVVSPNGFVVTQCRGTSDLTAQCNSGYYGNGFVCTACTRCDPNALYLANCTGNTTTDVVKCVCKPFYTGNGTSCLSVCRGCPLGKYGTDNETCLSCPYGTYGTVLALPSIESCVPCASGQTTGECVYIR